MLLLKESINSKKLEPLQLNNKVVEAFRTLYTTFIEAPILVYYNSTIAIKVETDTSNFIYLGILL